MNVKIDLQNKPKIFFDVRGPEKHNKYSSRTAQTTTLTSSQFKYLSSVKVGQSRNYPARIWSSLTGKVIQI